eukprot:COSAG02_NODE_2067_length_9945_cov_24.620150_9_plen_75_part_00
MIEMLVKQRSADMVTREQSRSSLIDKFYPAASEFKDDINGSSPTPRTKLEVHFRADSREISALRAVVLARILRY